MQSWRNSKIQTRQIYSIILLLNWDLYNSGEAEKQVQDIFCCETEVVI